MTKMMMGGAPDMARVMDLVRSGRAAEATAVLQGRSAEGGTVPSAGLTGASPLVADFPRVSPGRRRVRPGAGTPGMPRGHVEIGGERRDYALFVPKAPRANPALIVMLHGCTQDAEDFARGTGMNALADAEGLHVLWPEQGRSFNPMGCWNWFEPDHQARDAGEPALIAAMIGEVRREHGIGAGRVFVAGLSAGGAMAAVLAEEYPDILAAAGVHSGLPAGAARSMPEALTAMRNGGAGPGGQAMVPMIVFHGDADPTVAPRNGAALAKGIGEGTRDHGTTGGRGWTRIRGPGGEYWTVRGLGHAWSGGSAAGSHTDPAGPDASREMLRFFLQHI